jgi:hypothetical protein
MKRQSCDMPTVQAIEGDEDIKSSGAGIVQSGQTAGLAETATGTVWSGEPALQSTSGPVTGAKMFTAALARVTMWDGDEQRAEALALCLAHEIRRFSDSQDCWFMTPAVGEPTPEKWLRYHQLHPLALGAAMRYESDIANVMTYKAVVWPERDCSPIADEAVSVLPAEADRLRHMQAIATEAMLALYDGHAEKARSVGVLAARDFIECVDLIDPALIPRGVPLHGAVMSR